MLSARAERFRDCEQRSIRVRERTASLGARCCSTEVESFVIGTAASRLPSSRLTLITLRPYAERTSLAGMVIAAGLDNGKWTGIVAADGTVRVDIDPNVSDPRQRHRPFNSRVSARRIDGHVQPGTALGELQIGAPLVEQVARKRWGSTHPTPP